MVAISFALLSAVSGILVQSVRAAPSPTTLVDPFVRRDAEAPPFVKRAASCTFPSPPKTSSLSAPITVTGTFDGGNVRFDRGSGACTSGEGGSADTVFLISGGGTLQNVVIGANQKEGVRCTGSCNIYNVWFEDVCEDAITINQTSGQSNIVGGGAKGASDKVVQHNGGGTVKIDSYCVQTFGKLYRSCGNCSTQYKRTVLISQIIGKSGSTLAGVNSNYGDVAQFDKASLSLSSVSSICDTYQGNSSGSEPKKLTTNQSNAYCKF
ncbi:unnamed protein product [Rhizoctonia solani]|uniref:Pectate lyase n=1 Tax=Rhizoctonia solani TaxID=456999 RepID=A0A8H3GDU1_9AGAM|nr:unnamed protein product [Rhizoctonia solani]CAE6483912.1 unnamed protein product [Rhizoctonia solani]